MWSPASAILAGLLTLGSTTATAADTLVSIEAGAPTTIVERIHAIDLSRLGADLSRLGLQMPPRIDLELISDGDARARRTPPRIVGVSLEPDDIVIFCDRVLPYPYGSLESVFRHEVAHLALSSRARGQRLPRWLHEGVAMSVDRGWDTAGRLRLLLEMTGSPATADLARLFTSGMQPDAAQAYGLSAALVADIQRRHGAEAPGRIASRVASGIPFPQAFRLETGDTPEQAAQRAWRGYRRWTMWVSAATSEGAVWGVIVTLALLAFVAQSRRRTRRRRQWDDAEPSDTWPD
jgi:hypothetical protein